MAQTEVLEYLEKVRFKCSEYLSIAEIKKGLIGNGSNPRISRRLTINLKQMARYGIIEYKGDPLNVKGLKFRAIK